MDISFDESAQLGVIKSKEATAIRVRIPNHFRIINAPGINQPG
jgi:hypothetical protein